MTIFDRIDADDADGLRALLAGDPGAAGARDEQGLTALMRAYYRGGRGELFEAILAAGPPLDPWDRLLLGESEGLPAPDARTPDGFAPLHIAAFARNGEAAAALLEAGADPDALATASFARVTPLGTCAFAGANEVARLLLEHGADPNLTSEAEGGTPLDSAVANGNEELAELLRAHGARSGR